jgi:phosphate transport system substrate-binding protein
MKIAPFLVAGTFFVQAAAFAEVLEISGSTSVHKRVIEPHAAAIKAATGVELKMFPVGSGKGMLDLSEGRYRVAAISESLDEALASAEKAAKAEGKSFKRPADMKFHLIIDDVVVPVVHADNKIASLTREQARDLNTGKIGNWKEIGGADQPVRVVTGAPGSATRAVFQAKVMDGQPYAPDAQQMRTTAEEVKGVAVNRGAIGAMSENMAKAAGGRVRIVPGVVATRPLAFVTVGEPSPALRKVLAFLHSKEGARLLAE